MSSFVIFCDQSPNMLSAGHMINIYCDNGKLKL